LRDSAAAARRFQPAGRRQRCGFDWRGAGLQRIGLHRAGLAALALLAVDVRVVQDAQQPRADAEGVQVELVLGAHGAEIRFLHEIIGGRAITRKGARDAIDSVELLHRQADELVAG
jgi:hypothetical protein